MRANFWWADAAEDVLGAMAEAKQEAIQKAQDLLEAKALQEQLAKA